MQKIQKFVLLSLVLAVCYAASARATRADSVVVSGSTMGGFNGGSFSSNPGLGSLLSPALEFQGQPFSTPVNLNGVTVSQVTVGSFDLHTFHNFNFTGSTFSMQVTFTAPVVAGGSPVTIVANLSGTITANELFDGNEAITIDFNNNPQVFTFAGGSFTFSVQDLVVNEQSGFVDLHANLTATAVPEPATMLLMGTGLMSLAMGVRRRRKLGMQKKP